ncbi:hypothetical protein Ae201684P_018309 [Aphanomyces euteiches]|nr:hypothetical protein Ae201684P_018309 [Aphanomyces euteiches]
MSNRNNPVMYDIDTIGLDGETRKFEKPIFQTMLMFAAMVFALPIQWIYHWNLEHQWHAKGGALSGSTGTHSHANVFYPGPSSCIRFIGNLSGQSWVAIRHSQRVSIDEMHDHLKRYMWIGIGMNTVAALMVGFSSFQDTEEQINNNDNPGLGIIMIILSCFVQSAQYVFEEKLMGDGIDTAPPLIVVGMEGLWGLIMTGLIVYPIAYFVPGNDLGSYERIDDAWYMLTNSPTAQVAAAIFLIVILGYNVFAVFVTFLLNSIWHAILDNFRPVTVWGTDLLLFYVFTPRTFGEAWTSWSYLELTGMITLLLGTAVYNGTIQLPGHTYDEPLEGPVTPIRTPLAMASSSLSRSPLLTRNALKAAEIARRTPDPADRERVRKEYMTEYQGKNGNDANGTRRRLDPAGHNYGSMDT